MNNVDNLDDATVATGLETLRGSAVHAWASGAIGRFGSLDTLRLGRLWVVFGGGWYFILLVVGLWEIPNPFSPEGLTRLPLLRDLNVAYALLVSAPTVAYFLLTDDRLLKQALSSLEQSQVLSVTAEARAQLLRVWGRRFLRVNMSAHASAAVVGVAVGIGNFVAYSDPQAGFWIVVDGRVGATGWIFSLAMGALYALITVFVLRTFAITWFLRDLVRAATIRVLPFHPDNCGGLKPVGRIALRSQYTLTVLGVNLGILVWLTFSYLGATSGIVGLVMLAVCAYLVLGPFVFLAPLLPFRQGMLSARSEMLSIVAREAYAEVGALRQALDEHRIREYDTEALERLNRVGALISQQPIWPFDVSTLRKFLSAYVIPVVGFGAALAFNAIAERLLQLSRL